MDSYNRLYQVIRKLRSPEGCPWDREQTPSSLAPDLIEEAYELIEAIDNDDHEHIAEEIGDLVLVASMIGYMHQEKELFHLDDVFNGIADKLIRRHPHVFGDVEVADSDEVIRNWNQIKEKVEGRKKDSILDGIPVSFPPLARAYKFQKKAAKSGFDWPGIEPVFDKLQEETDELHRELDAEERNKDRVIDECGDLLFSVVNLCRHLKVDPTIALDRSNRKFKRRFNHVEKRVKASGREFSDFKLDELDEFWDESKKSE